MGSLVWNITCALEPELPPCPWAFVDLCTVPQYQAFFPKPNATINGHCSCVDSCFGIYIGVVLGTVAGVEAIIAGSFLLARRYGPQIDPRLVRMSLESKPTEHPDPNVSPCRFNSFRWLPFTSNVLIASWFVAMTIYVIWDVQYSVQQGTVGNQYAWTAYIVISTTLMMFWLFFNIALVSNGINGLVQLSKTIKTADSIVHNENVHQVIMLPNYKEEVSLMSNTMARLASQLGVNVRKNVTIVLAMERGEEGWEAKAKELQSKFPNTFADILVTAHPRGIPGEQPGKSSNMSWCFNDLRNRQKPDGSPLFDDENTVITLMDADALAHPRFLAALSNAFAEARARSQDPNSMPEHHTRFWQCPVAFYQNLDEVDFLNRASAVILAFSEMANAGGFVDWGVVGFNPRVPVNTYSMSWKLLSLMDGGDAFCVADEQHNLYKANWLTHGATKLVPIFLPLSVYSVTADGFLAGFRNRFTQITRWLYGNGYEYAYWSAKYSENMNGMNVETAAAIQWRLFIMSSINLPQPVFFCLFGFLWAFFTGFDYWVSVRSFALCFCFSISRAGPCTSANPAMHMLCLFVCVSHSHASAQAFTPITDSTRPPS